MEKEIFRTTDCVCTGVVLWLGIVTRLWRLSYPDSVVFDEIHFGNFTNWYIAREHFFDIHPPLAKLIMAGFAYLGEYDGKIDFTTNYGKQYPNEDFVLLRFTPAFFSAMVPALIFLSMRMFKLPLIPSLLSAVLCLFETSLITEGRFILSDGILHFFVSLHILSLALSLLDQRFLLFCGITLGCACSCKSTAWALPLVDAIAHTSDIISRPKFIQNLFRRGSILFFSLLGVYILSYTLHFIILPYHGQGTPYLPQKMQLNLLNPSAPLHSKFISSPSLLSRIFQLSKTMHGSNMHITTFHPYQSRPTNWPLLTGNWVGFYSDGSCVVNCHGNIFVYLSALLGVLGCAFYQKNLLFSFGWFISFVPFLRIPRSMYLYHYHISLLFGCMACGAFVDCFKDKKFIALTICILALVGLYLWSPLVYGFPEFDMRHLLWTRNWMYGDSFHQNLRSQSG